MKIAKYASIINAIGLVSLLLGVFLTFNAIKANLDQYNVNKQDLVLEADQSRQMIQKTKDLMNGVGIEDLAPEELIYIESLSDSTIDMYSNGIDEEFTKRTADMKSIMFDDMTTSAGKQIALIILGIALIFVSKGFHAIALEKSE